MTSSGQQWRLLNAKKTAIIILQLGADSGADGIFTPHCVENQVRLTIAES